MKDEKVNLNSEQAMQSLDLLKQTQTKLSLSVRPPIWLSSSAGFAYGLFTLSFSFGMNQGIWMWGVLLSIIMFTSLIVYWAQTLKKRGIKGKIWPSNGKSRFTWILSAVVFAILVSSAISTANNGYLLMSALISIITGVCFTATLHYFPNYQFVDGKSYQGNSNE